MDSNLSYILNQLGEDREHYFQAIAPPIIQTSNFNFPTVESFGQALTDELTHTIYTRGNNPTVAILREKVAALEKAEDALIFSSGSAAIAAAVIGNVRAGDHILCVDRPYSWTYKLITQFLSRFGVSHTFVDGCDLNAIKGGIQNNTRILYLESPNTMTYELQDLKACAKIAKEHGIVTICDNSYASPLYQNPIALGVDIVVHSGTKYLNGHSDVVSGILCGSKAMVKKIFESEYMTIGAIISPYEAALILRGLRTLPLRMERSSKSCKKIVDHLSGHPKVRQVFYPFHDSFPQYELAKQQMSGAGGLFSVRIKAETISQAKAFCNRLDRFLIAASWGGHESLIIPICGMYDIPGRPNPLLPWDFVRFYIGLEDPDWLIEDIEQAFDLL